jgi:hypothetical protein
MESGGYQRLMLRPDGRVLVRLAALRDDKELIGWLSANLEAYRHGAVMQRDDTELRITQGKAQVLTELLELVETSPELLDKARRA